MKHVIFYSWQADLPNSTNRGFIHDALEQAANTIATDLDIEPVIERDTQGTPGSPDIAQTIFAKIAASNAFLADITLINPTSSERRTPNPNVLLELGYAIATIGPERTILVMNTAYGPIENLPFDLKMRRVIAYTITADTIEKAPERKRLASILRDAITSILTTPTKPRQASAAIQAQELQRVLHQAHFHTRVLSLIDDISHIDGHYITNMAKSAEYDRERRALQSRFTEEYHTFEQTMTAARSLFASSENADLLTAMRAVTATVQELVSESLNRFDPIDLRRLPAMKKTEAEQAAKTLSTLVSQRLNTLQ